MKQLEQILNVSNQELDNINTSFINNYMFYHDTSYFHGPSGKEHYRLLCYISTLFSKEIFYDVGTNKCMSTAALSMSMKNQVKSYDIVEIIPANPILPRVEYILGDVTKDKNLIYSSFIFFDVDHDGKFEKIFYDHLKKIKYKGLIMCDDIKVGWGGEMEAWWDSIKEDKYDITEKGHWSGTGLIHFK